MNIAFFDFDGTITKRDSFLDFIISSAGLTRFLCGMFLLLPTLIRYMLKLSSNQEAKQKVIQYFFQGMPYKDFCTIAFKYSTEKIPRIVRKIAMMKIADHKKNGDIIVVVSASPEEWLRPWCNRNSVELIGTRLEVINDQITGKIMGMNCHGEEKVQRIHQNYKLDQYERIYSYGNSSGDRDLLDIADVKYYKWRLFS